MTPDEKTPIEDGTYDVMLCSAGMFPGKYYFIIHKFPLPSLLDIILHPPLFSFLGSIVPQAFKELLRIVKVGGILAWNIADGYEGFNDFFLSYDKIIAEHIKNGDWEEVYPVKKEENMLFNDAGYTHVMKKLK